MNVAVIGAGIFGIAAALELRSRGHNVTVFEQGKVPYEKASSTDVSKGIRRTWYAGDNETYVELVERAALRWRAWEKQFDTQIYHQTGGLTFLTDFAPGTPMYESWKFLRARGATEVQVLSTQEARTRFPQFAFKDEETVVYDPWAGYLESGRAVESLAKIARAEGVQIMENTPVARVEDSSSYVKVFIEDGPMDFDRVVVAAGVWVGRLLPELGSHLLVTHQHMVLIEVENPGLFSYPTMPVWGFYPDIQGWYGFPLLREGYVKVSKEPPGEIVDPDIDRRGTPEFTEQTMEFLRERIPEMARGKVVGGRSCLYTNTPDDHFVIDWVPGSQRVLVAGGGSGHGFKFGGSIGEIIADALEAKDNPLGKLFRIGDRFKLKDRKRHEESRGFARPAQRY